MKKPLNGAVFCGAILGLALLGLVFASPAAAQSTEIDAPSVTVRIDARGVAAGEPRAVQRAHNAIVRAARRVCGLGGGPNLSLRQMADARACVRDTVDQTVVIADRPALTAYYAALEGENRFATNFGPVPDTVLAAIEAAAG